MRDLTRINKLSATIVLYHTGSEVLNAIQCFKDSDVYLDLYVVNNSPEDMSHYMSLWSCPGIHPKTASRNLGYGRANNLVLDELKSQFHVICNPDVTFDKTLLRRMMDRMEETGAAIMTPRVLNADGTEQFLPRRDPTVRYLLGHRFGHLSKKLQALSDAYTLADQPSLEPRDVEYATGCFMMIRTQVLTQRLKGFDPRFFLYHEDSDLSRQVRERLGERIVYDPSLTITHAWKRDSAKQPRAAFHHLCSTVKYFNKWGWKW